VEKHTAAPALVGGPPRPGSFSYNGQFTGNYDGAVWNGEAVFARSCSRHALKKKYVCRLMRNRSFLGLTECHGAAGDHLGIELPEGVKAFWSPGTTHRGGVGILVDSTWLKQFDQQDLDSCWDVVIPGRLAFLRLRGPRGRIDICVCYFPTGTQSEDPDSPGELLPLRRERSAMREKLRAAMAPRETALSVVMGDFNTVVEAKDRWNCLHQCECGARDAAEETHWKEAVALPAGLYEIRQSGATFHNSATRSRIDRVYTNQPPSDQLDKEVGCWALEWVQHLSQHRALAFTRRSPVGKCDEDRPIQDWVVRHERFPKEVSTRFLGLCGKVGTNKLEGKHLWELKLLKQAIREAADEIILTKPSPVRDKDDKAGHALALLRALEKGRKGAIRAALGRLPEASERILLDNPATWGEKNRIWLRGLAHDWAKEAAIDALRSLSVDEEDESEDKTHGSADEDEMVDTRGRARAQVLKKLKRISPGRGAAIAAVINPQGEVVTDPEEIAAAQRGHWADVFKERHTSKKKRHQWLEDEKARGPSSLHALIANCHADDWNIRVQDVARAIKLSGKSSPGPDGIPFLAYKRLGPLAQGVLHKAILSLMQDGASDTLQEVFAAEDNQCLFNDALMVFLPKKPSGVWEGVDYYEPGDTRPLSIVNSDNRLMASAVRLRMETVLEPVISEDQQGFLSGRSLLKNVVDIDDEMRKAVLGGGNPAAIFFDFKAAFPSVSHAFLLDTLRHLGLPQGIVQFIASLYFGNRCFLSVGGKKVRGFSISAGIRQGCPLSPLLFALVADLLLRRLKAFFPGSTRKAYADDLAMVTRNFPRDAAPLIELFNEYARVSGLSLNMDKVVVIPLWIPDSKIAFPEGAIGPRLGWLQLIKRAMVIFHKAWKEATFAGKATYLGFTVGPEAGWESWGKALGKAEKKADVWREVGCSLMYTVLLYNIYILPTLSFVIQLSPPPPSWEEDERRILRRLIRGPWCWALPREFRNLKRSLHFPAECRDLRVQASAAQFRVALNEASSSGGLRVADRVAALDEACSASELIHVFGFWGGWLRGGFSRQLLNNMTNLDTPPRAFSRQALEDQVAKGAPRPWDRKLTRRVRDQTQSKCHAVVLGPGVCIHAKMRKELSKWNLGCFLRPLTDRAFRRLQWFRSRMPPRILAACLRSWWDGWCTSQRMHEAAGVRWCPWCLQSRGDSLLHFCVCHRLQEWRTDMLALPHRDTIQGRKQQFFALDKDTTARDELLLEGVAMAASYQAYNCIRCSGAGLSPEDNTRVLHQSVKELVGNSTFLSKLVDLAWARRRQRVAPLAPVKDTSVSPSTEGSCGKRPAAGGKRGPQTIPSVPKRRRSLPVGHVTVSRL